MLGLGMTVFGVLLVGYGLLRFSPRHADPAGTKPAARVDIETAPQDEASKTGKDNKGRPLADFTGDPVVGGLNDPAGSVQRDIEIVSRVFQTWQTNFPLEGNPVGGNREITTSLTGRNRLGLVLLPPDFPAINVAGEWCDRWGTPWFFHQISGREMEVRSAGPDRQLYTADDVTGGL